MDINGEQCDSLPQIESHVLDFYKALFEESHDKTAFLNSDFWDQSYIVSDHDRNELVKYFIELELHETVSGSDASGAPSPNGFSFLFYQHFWKIVKDDLMQLLHHFYVNSLKVAKLNHAMLCLIPKEHNANLIQKYRPINLVDCSYKIISKILTNRMAHIMNKIGDSAQAAFIQGRYILDNVLATNEIIHYAKLNKKKRHST
jgi:Reverse transcriptase (RNA-dependent DNA polymerase)